MLRPDRTAQVLELADGEAATPAGLCAAIGCRHVEVVTLAGDLDMWLDGEGPRATPVPPVNVIAALLGAAFGCGTRYVGTVVLTGGADRQGNPAACPMSGSEGCSGTWSSSAPMSETPAADTRPAGEAPGAHGHRMVVCCR